MMTLYEEILQKHGNVLQNYAASTLPKFQNYLDKARQPYVPVLTAILHFYLFMSYLVEDNLIPNDNKHFSIRVLFAKSALCLFGVYTSFMNGLVSEGSQSLRSLFEAYVNLKLILEKDTDERLQLYENFAKVDKWNNLKANQDLLTKGIITQAQFDKTYERVSIQKVTDDFNAIKADYHPKQPYHWAWKIYQGQLDPNRNPSLKFIAERLGLGIDYVKIYSPMSISAHSSPTMVNIMSTGNSVSLAPQFTRSIANQSCVALEYSTAIVELVVDYFHFRDPNEIKIFVRNFFLNVIDLAKEGRT